MGAIMVWNSHWLTDPASIHRRRELMKVRQRQSRVWLACFVGWWIKKRRLYNKLAPESTGLALSMFEQGVWFALSRAYFRPHQPGHWFNMLDCRCSWILIHPTAGLLNICGKSVGFAFSHSAEWRRDEQVPEERKEKTFAFVGWLEHQPFTSSLSTSSTPIPAQEQLITCPTLLGDWDWCPYEKRTGGVDLYFYGNLRGTWTLSFV